MHSSWAGNKRRGFTLIEVLLGIFILAVGLTVVGLAAMIVSRQIGQNRDEVMAMSSIRSVESWSPVVANDRWTVFRDRVFNGYSVGQAVFRTDKYPDTTVTWVWKKSDESDNSLVEFDNYEPINGEVLVSWMGHVYYVEKDEKPKVRYYDKDAPFLVLHSPVIDVQTKRFFDFRRNN